MNIAIGEKALITTDNWFFAPDGKSYRAVFGTVKGVKSAEETLGIKTNSKSTNWYVEIGNMTLAGCQIHYAIRADKCHDGNVLNWTSPPEGGVKEFEQPSSIYFTD
jgi:hypothetical protein